MGRKESNQTNKQEASEYDQKMSQSQTTDQPMAPRGRGIEHEQAQNSKNTIKLNSKITFYATGQVDDF